MSASALVDSNVIVASVASEHQHHESSLRFAALTYRTRFAVAAHSFAEAYNTLTRGGKHGPFRFSPDEALAVLEDLRGRVELLGLSATQTFDGIRRFAAAAGIGPRLYDKLIGDVAVLHGVGTIVTWNGVHVKSLFPSLTVQTPAEYAIAGL